MTRFAAFLRLCAARTGQILNLASLGAELGLDAKTARGWLSVLVAGYVAHLLPAHHANLGKRITKHPKLYFLDTGLACRLMGISGPDELRAHPAWGALAETWIVGEAIKTERSAGNTTDNLFYWRSHDGTCVNPAREAASGARRCGSERSRNCLCLTSTFAASIRPPYPALRGRRRD